MNSPIPPAAPPAPTETKPPVELLTIIDGVVWGVRIIRDPDAIQCTQTDYRDNWIDLHPFTTASCLARAIDGIREVMAQESTA